MMNKPEYFILPSRVLADQILFLRAEIDRETTPMQILKLVYISHGWMLGNYGKKLMNEPAEAWQYGPVVPSIYDRFKVFRGDPIDIALQDHSEQFDLVQFALVKEVVKQYRDYDGWALSHITHRKGTPWDTVYRGGKGLWSIIPDKIIQNYYARLVPKR